MAELTDAERLVMRGLRLAAAVAVTQPAVRRRVRHVLRHAVGPETGRAIERALAQNARVLVRRELGEWLVIAELPDGRRFKRPVTAEEAEAIDVAFADADGEHPPGGRP